jgi:hypothetical protein
MDAFQQLVLENVLLKEREGEGKNFDMDIYNG